MHIHWQGRNIARKTPNNFRRPRDVAQGRTTRRWSGPTPSPGDFGLTGLRTPVYGGSNHNRLDILDLARQAHPFNCTAIHFPRVSQCNCTPPIGTVVLLPFVRQCFCGGKVVGVKHLQTLITHTTELLCEGVKTHLLSEGNQLSNSTTCT